MDQSLLCLAEGIPHRSEWNMRFLVYGKRRELCGENTDQILLVLYGSSCIWPHTERNEEKELYTMVKVFHAGSLSSSLPTPDCLKRPFFHRQGGGVLRKGVRPSQVLQEAKRSQGICQTNTPFMRWPRRIPIPPIWPWGR